MKKHTMLIGLCLLLLSACTPAPMVEEIPSTETPVVTPTYTPKPTATAQPSPTPSPLKPTVTAMPSPTPSSMTVDVGEEIETEVQRGYMPLLFLEAMCVMSEETARQVQAEEIDGMEAFGQLIAIAAIGQAVEEVFEDSSPPSYLEEAWAEGQQALPLMRGIIADWWDDEITSAEVPELLEPAREQMRRAMQLADKALSREYGISEERLATFRAEAMEELRDSMKDRPSDPVYTPSPTMVDTSESKRGESRHNPAGIGEVFVIHRETWLDGNSTLELELVSLISGDEAWEIVQEANMFNEEPGEGKEYILAKFRVAVLETEEEPFEVSHAMFDVVDAEGKVYGDFVSVAGLDPTLRVELYEGAEHEGWTYFLVDKQDTPVAAFDRGEDSEAWFTLRP